MSETKDCEPITLEELDEQMTGLIMRACDSKIPFITIIAALESSKLSLAIMISRNANEQKIGMEQNLN